MTKVTADMVGGRLMVGHLVLVQGIGVRIPAPELVQKRDCFRSLFFVLFQK